MNKSQKIRIDVNNPNTDRFLKIKLEQNIDFLEILTLDIKTKDIYTSLNSDYGVLVGRVIANNGIGVPNAKVSIFIPLDEEDENDSEIRSIYPYKSPRDKNSEGKRYNLLPRVTEYDYLSGYYKPEQPFGSFPIKPEIVTNRTLLNVYKKYYKFSTVTNSFGDYMIFGAPLGLHTVHMSVDITDIGRYSMTPGMMVNILGYPNSLFTNNNTKIKPSQDLEDLPNIETQEISVDIKPFWGDKENFEIGITRQDFRIRAELIDTFIIFGNAVTDNDLSTWGSYTNENERNDIDLVVRRAYKFHLINQLSEDDNRLKKNMGINLKKNSRVSHIIYEYSQEITDDDIQNGNIDITKIKPIPRSEYVVYEKDSEGNFAFQLVCNRRKIIFDDAGNEVVVDSSFEGGIYTRFRGFMILGYDHINLEPNEIILHYHYFKTRIKIPQTNLPETDNSFGFLSDSSNTVNEWFKQSKSFEGGKIYSVSKFNGLVSNTVGHDGSYPDLGSNNEVNIDYYTNDKRNDLSENLLNNVGVIITNNLDDETNNEIHHFPHNGEYDEMKLFGANWLNFSVYLPNITHIVPKIEENYGFTDLKGFRANTFFSGYVSEKYEEITLPTIDNQLGNPYGFKYHKENYVDINGFNIRTGRMLRCDLHWSDFVEVPIGDIRRIINKLDSEDIGNGFTSDDIPLLAGKYRNGVNTVENDEDIFNNKPSCPYDGGKINGIPENESDPKTYFFTGKDGSCVRFLDNLGII